MLIKHRITISKYIISITEQYIFYITQSINFIKLSKIQKFEIITTWVRLQFIKIDLITQFHIVKIKRLKMWTLIRMSEVVIIPLKTKKKKKT